MPVATVVVPCLRRCIDVLSTLAGGAVTVAASRQPPPQDPAPSAEMSENRDEVIVNALRLALACCRRDKGCVERRLASLEFSCVPSRGCLHLFLVCETCFVSCVVAP